MPTLKLELQLGGPAISGRLEQDRHCSICTGALPDDHSRTCPVSVVKRLKTRVAVLKAKGQDTAQISLKLVAAKRRLRSAYDIGLQEPPRECTFPDHYDHNHVAVIKRLPNK